jgi:hypothetical protein
MAELKDGWNGPMKLTVKVAYGKGLAQDGSGTQWKGKYAPHKDILQWDAICEELGSTKITITAPEMPVAGTVYEDAWVEVAQNPAKPQYPFRNMFTKEDKAAKNAGGGKFGGAKPNYTTEQEAMKDGMLIAVTGLSTGAFKDGQGAVIQCDSANLKKLGSAIAKIILEAGKS